MADPTIPAGMVPWAGGDSAPADWDGGPVLFRNGSVQNGSGSSWTHPWAKGIDGEPEMPGATTPFDIFAYTPALATPTPPPDSAVTFTAMDVEHVLDGGTVGSQPLGVTLIGSKALTEFRIELERYECMAPDKGDYAHGFDAETAAGLSSAADEARTSDGLRQAIDDGLRAFCADTGDFTMSSAMRRTAVDFILGQPGAFAVPPAATPRPVEDTGGVRGKRALEWLASQQTIGELMQGGRSEWAGISAGDRPRFIAERKKAHDAAVLDARAALARGGEQ